MRHSGGRGGVVRRRVSVPAAMLGTALLVAALLAAVVLVAAPRVPRSASASTRGVGVYVWPRVSDSGTTTHLAVYDFASHRVRQLTHPPDLSVDYGPRVSPDGRYVLFGRATRTLRFEVRVIGLDGRGERRLDHGSRLAPEGATHPVWAPDGHRVIYTMQTGDRAGELWLTDLAGEFPIRISAGSPWLSESAPTFSPAGYRVVLAHDPTGRTALFRQDRDGSHSVQLTAWSLGVGVAHLSTARSGPTRDLLAFTVGAQLATMPATCRSVAACYEKLRYVAPGRIALGATWAGGRAIVFHDPTEGRGREGTLWALIWDGDRPVLHELPVMDHAEPPWRHIPLE
ncbi:TolB family protein [Leifsonia sp. P73]|uniref:TolB family protein n=1 Tax=Leifsonia sp. P73 TaxID=3423959 RepID=UPI003DA6603C